MTPGSGLFQIEDCVDEAGAVTLPPGATLIALIDGNIAHLPDMVAYRYLDYSGSEPRTFEVTWSELGVRLAAIAARVQAVTQRGDRVAIMAPQGLDYVFGFFAAIKAGAIAVPLFAPELPGHAERLDTALHDARPAAILTTAAAAMLYSGTAVWPMPCKRPLVICWRPTRKTEMDRTQMAGPAAGVA